MRRSVFLAVAAAVALHVVVSAQAPHGGANVRPQAGANVNAAAGIVDPSDPAALVKSDILLQRQNETMVAGSTRNADHLLAAANDYRFVDFPDDPYFSEGPQSGLLARLVAKVFRRPSAEGARKYSAAAVGGWTGVYRSCDRGGTWLGSAVPGSPLDNSPASLRSPLKALSNSAPFGAHAETTDPVLVAGPGGRMHLVNLGYIRWADGHVSDSRMFYSSYTDRNNLEGGSCFNYDYTIEIDRGAAYANVKSQSPFLDKPSMAVDKDGTLYVSYTVFIDDVNSKVVIARSTNGGTTWSKTQPLLSLGFLRNHGTTMAVDPLNGTVYVAWRLFYQNWPLMVISKSYDRGRTFFPATPISNWWPAKSFDQILAQLKAAKLQPFDQFTNNIGDPARARALAFPHLVAGVVNGRTKLFAVWQERADVSGDPMSATFGLPSAGGSPRVMLSMSSDGGWTWTPRRAIDAGPRPEDSVQTGPPRLSGPQLQPSLSISGTSNPQLLLFYYEARRELDPPFASNFVSGIDRQLDVRVARIDPLTGALLAPSTQVSQYDIKANSFTPDGTFTPDGRPLGRPELAEAAPGFPATSRGNATIYNGGRQAFFGDYAIGAPATPFEYTGGTWKWTAQPSSTLAMWTDHRDLQYPKVNNVPDLVNGDWTRYSPVKAFAPLNCDFVATRNANPYFAEVGGVVVGSPQTFKLLNIQRAFVTYVANRTSDDRLFRLTLAPSAGIQASFEQFGPAVTVATTQVFANSSHTRSVWVEASPTNPRGSIRMLVDEIDSNGQLVPGGYRTRLTLNPDPNNDALTPIPSQAPVPPNTSKSISVTELHTPQVSAPQVSAFVISAPQVSAPQVSAPQVSAPQVSAPQVSAPQVSAPQVSAPQVSAPQVSALAPGEPPNGTDITYTVVNSGNTDSAYNTVFNVPNVEALLSSGSYNFQVLIVRTSLAPGFLQTAGGCVPAAQAKVQVLANLQVPQVSAPQISAIQNPQVSAPQISAIATFAIAPEGGAIVANPSDDAQSTVLRDEVKVVLRAIRLKPFAEIAALGVPAFNPGGVVLNVTSTSTNVLNGVIDPPGTQPIVITVAANLLADLAIANYLPAPRSAASGNTVTLSAWRHVNLGSATPTADGNIRNGFYLSTDPVITSQDIRLGGTTNSNASLPPGGWVDWAGPTVTIPANTAPGNYYIGILVDDSGLVTESNESNNYVSEPITIITSSAFGGALIDPSGDAGGAGNPDLVSGSVSVEGSNLRLSVRFAPGTFNPATTVAQFVLDTDQNPGTGHQGTDSGCGADNGVIGAEYIVDMGSTAFGSQARVLPFVGPCNVFGSPTGNGTVTYSTDGLEAVIPLAMIGNDDGLLNFKVVTYRYLGQGFTGVLDRMSDGGLPPGTTGGIRQWPTSVGGNGNFYEYVRQGGLSWTAAEAAARQRTFAGRTGRLVSITSAGENAFVDGLRDGGALRAWIGLYDPDETGPGSWVWSSGEAASYINWAPGEPNNSTTEFWVEMFGGGSWNGEWNNNTVLDSVYPTLGYIVEYPTPPPPPSGGTITSVSPSTGASGGPGYGFLVVRGTGFPDPSPGSGEAIVSNGASTANGFILLGPSTNSAHWISLPSGFPQGPATIQLKNLNTNATTNAFPITVAATPGTPIITNILNSDFMATTSVNPGSTIYIQADGIDTSGSFVRFQQGASYTDVPSFQANSSPTIGLVAQVTVPSGLGSGAVSVSIRQGSSAFSAPVTLTVPPQ